MWDWETTIAFLGYGFHPKMMLATYAYLQLVVGISCLFPALQAEVTSKWSWVAGYWLCPPLLWFRLHYGLFCRLLRGVGMKSPWALAFIAGMPALVVSLFLLVFVFEFGHISQFFQNDTPDWMSKTNMFWAPFVVSIRYLVDKLNRPHLTTAIAVIAILGATHLHQFRAYRFFLYWENYSAWRAANELTDAELKRLQPKAKNNRIQVVGEAERIAGGARGTYQITVWSDVGRIDAECVWTRNADGVDVQLTSSNFKPAVTSL